MPSFPDTSKLELALPDLTRGRDTLRLQEWLALAGATLDVDGVYGSQTAAALAAYQRANGLKPGPLDPVTWMLLTRAMREALVPPRTDDPVREVAARHLSSRPREVGGPNAGPWVRLYCGGRDGPAFAWCAGFVSYVLRQARRDVVPYTLSCDELAAAAKRSGRFVAEGARPAAPCVFLLRAKPGDWVHTGIVTEWLPGGFATVEGNTNEGGSREGVAVLARTRPLKGADFVRLD